MRDALLERLRSMIPMPVTDPNVPVLDEEGLDARIQRDEATIVCFYTGWCGFCRAFLPTYEDAAGELPAETVAADISDYGDPRWSRFDVDTVPTLVAFQDGEELARVDGRTGRGLKREDVERIAQLIPA